MKTIVAGNWKMHKDHAEALALIDEIAKERDTLPQNVVVVVAPAYPFLAEAAERLPNVIVAAQNCHFAEQGLEITTSRLPRTIVQPVMRSLLLMIPHQRSPSGLIRPCVLDKHYY